MSKIDDFFQTVFFNMKKKKIDPYKNRVITRLSLLKAIKRYFNLVSDKTAYKYAKRMVEEGYIEPFFSDFRLTDYAIEKFYNRWSF